MIGKRNLSSSFFIYFIIYCNMVTRMILFTISFFLMVFGLTFIIIYINLFSFGYNIYEYLEFIFTSCDCLCFFIGFVMLILLLKKRRNK